VLKNEAHHAPFQPKKWCMTLSSVPCVNLGESNMHFSIELPDNLGQELLQKTDIQQFIHKAIEKMLLEEKRESELLIDIVKNLPEIACFMDKGPLEIQKTLRDEWN
jgi:phospholipid N-methyltransferase